MATKKTPTTPEAPTAGQAVPAEHHSAVTADLHHAITAIEAVIGRASLLAGSGLGELAQAAGHMLGDARTALEHVKNARHAHIQAALAAHAHTDQAPAEPEAQA